MTQKRSITCLVFGLVLLVIGLAVFGIRLIHAGPYSMPGGAGFYGGLIAIALGCLLLWKQNWRPWGWIAALASPFILFPSIYSIMGESEEVISLFATDAKGQVVDLRLWIVDREDGAWVGMGRDKAVTNQLDGQQMTMLRAGERVCVIPALYEDRATTGAIHQMKVDKYKVAQWAGAIGLYPLEATENTVVLRLDACADDAIGS